MLKSAHCRKRLAGTEKRSRIFGGGLVAAILFLCVNPGPAVSRKAPVLVELFTAQGCVSCPPAEEFLTVWGMEAFERGEIAPLAFHVDYWDRLGWKDNFGSAEFTRRQYAYCRAFGLRHAYTPQMVVSGRVEFNGSNRRKAEQEVARFRDREPMADIVLRLSWEKEVLNLNVEVRFRWDEEKTTQDPRLVLALFENGNVTNVSDGKNAGRVLRESFVVRRFDELGALEKGKKIYRKTVSLTWDPQWKKQSCGITLFVQDATSLDVAGVKTQYPL